MIVPQARFFATPDPDGSDSDFASKSKGPTNAESMNGFIQKQIDENDVCLFMKGSKKMPACGFSRFVVILLHTYGVKNIHCVDVLADDLLRQQIKEFTNWPTIPQVYIK